LREVRLLNTPNKEREREREREKEHQSVGLWDDYLLNKRGFEGYPSIPWDQKIGTMSTVKVTYGTGGVSQVVEHLLSKCKTLSSTSTTTKTKVLATSGYRTLIFHLSPVTLTSSTTLVLDRNLGELGTNPPPKMISEKFLIISK
jgi:hypothetical protein